MTRLLVHSCSSASAATTLHFGATGASPPLTHTLPHYHVTWRIPAAPPLGDAFDLAHPPLPVLRTGAARRLWKALCPFWEGCCCCRLRATGNAITPSPRDGGSYRVALQQYKSFRQDSTLDLCQAGRRRSFARQGLSDEASRPLVLVGVCGDDSALWRYGRKPPLTHTLPHYHVTWRIPAAPPLGDAFDLAQVAT